MQRRVFDCVAWFILREADYKSALRASWSCFEEGFQFGGDFAAEAGDLGELFQSGGAEALDRAEFFQQRRFSPFTDSRKFVENALGNFLQTQFRIVSVREAMRLVAHALQKFQGASVVIEPQRVALAGHINLLEFLREADDRNVRKPE